MKDKKKILFVCLGNICRSSSAEGVMKHLIEQAGREDEFVIDSAGNDEYRRGRTTRENCPIAECVPTLHAAVTT